MQKILPKPIQFEWDKGNMEKNWVKHSVTDKESEEPFFDHNRKMFKDRVHSQQEERYALIGLTNQQRLLMITFTMRYNRIRVISARDANRKENPLYEKKA